MPTKLGAANRGGTDVVRSRNFEERRSESSLSLLALYSARILTSSSRRFFRYLAVPLGRCVDLPCYVLACRLFGCPAGTCLLVILLAIF